MLLSPTVLSALNIILVGPLPRGDHHCWRKAYCHFNQGSDSVHPGTENFNGDVAKIRDVARLPTSDMGCLLLLRVLQRCNMLMQMLYWPMLIR
jgi:hypothetical protein